MSKIVNEAIADLRTLVMEAMGKAVADGKFPETPLSAFTVVVPADLSHGD